MLEKTTKFIQEELSGSVRDSLKIENLLTLANNMVEVEVLCEQLERLKKRINRLDYILKIAKQLNSTENAAKSKFSEVIGVISNFVSGKKNVKEVNYEEIYKKDNALAYLREYGEQSYRGGFSTLFKNDPTGEYQQKIDDAIAIKNKRS